MGGDRKFETFWFFKAQVEGIAFYAVSLAWAFFMAGVSSQNKLKGVQK